MDQDNEYDWEDYDDDVIEKADILVEEYARSRYVVQS